MPEGHTVHRIARQLGLDLVGQPLAVSSPQGRFTAGARRLDGQVLVASWAVGKQLFLEFESGDVLRVHLGLFGAWDFFGRLTPLLPGSSATGSMGAPRLRRAVRMGEGERDVDGSDGPFPPDPVGQVRVRLASAETVADLRGPSACEVLDPSQAAALVARLGPDPAAHAAPGAGDPRTVMVDRLTDRSVAVGQLLMDQSVVAGIGNIYRAELLFRARLDPHTPGRRVPREVAGALWDDWAVLLAEGIRTGEIVTRDVPSGSDPTLRHWVYHRAGLPCLVSGTPVVVEPMAGRNLYWCPTCQR
ncbi:Fpg/Nei family DNA glycosylase [Cellulomonas sp. URHD0024]|uniref:Fpg/Nei family DNA glycosylase n=1 Tax=Cellulomonas sp. URHD0024 TaxID=1302620 RepID=UPI0003FA9660|nr:DNA-formamidopyrimidine glycosylase family protein [Cellulomonas sp. URHD0024]